ncbi:hypothetical protein DB43_GE00240 [Parachlamydia acanthamoebae]|uniref:Methyltransferase domain-containing protein n=2 Tax=Parachlamydia acanthamoebae TaxID=83552 RepID=A0A0C1EBX8_9BACT|nr:hypothetical protein DB43_GE00240 [Parachlamydia acanthamoebae]
MNFANFIHFLKCKNRNFNVIFLINNRRDGMNKQSESYRELCTEFYVLDNPHAPLDALRYYLACAAEANGSILEPMCGAGRFLIPLIEEGYDVTGFDNSPHMLEVCRNKCFEKKSIHN